MPNNDPRLVLLVKQQTEEFNKIPPFSSGPENLEGRIAIANQIREFQKNLKVKNA